MKSFISVITFPLYFPPSFHYQHVNKIHKTWNRKVFNCSDKRSSEPVNKPTPQPTDTKQANKETKNVRKTDKRQLKDRYLLVTAIFDEITKRPQCSVLHKIEPCCDLS